MGLNGPLGITEYKIIAATDINTFNKVLSEHVLQGWEPAAHVEVTPHQPPGGDYGLQYTQQLYRQPKPAPTPKDSPQ